MLRFTAVYLFSRNYIVGMRCMISLFSILSVCTAALKADIRADTNRDGIVDMSGSSDCYQKQTWTNDRGAIFLPNIGDTDRRCSKLALRTSPTNEQLSACHDASDDVQRAPQYLAPLRTVPVKHCSGSAVGYISVPDPRKRPFVRIFIQHGSAWKIVRDNEVFTAEKLRHGLVLGIDARDTRRPGKWDGRVTVRFTIKDRGEESTDEVMLRVAPVMTHHHLQKVDKVLAVRGNDSSTPWQNRFIKDLESALRNTGFDEPLYLFDGSDDIWAQDFVEPGYASMPGPNGPVIIRIMIRSSQDTRVAGRQVFEYMRNTGAGAVQELGGPRSEINSMGNLECIPPFTHNETTFPHGRILMGKHGAFEPHILKYFRAQEVQDPLLLDTAWLWVGHVDEFIQFLPADTKRGWVVMVNDPEAGINLLRDAQSAGHGSVKLYSRQEDPPFPGVDCSNTMYSCITYPVGNATIDDALADESFVSTNIECKRRIEANLDIIRSATGISDVEIHRIPALFEQLPLAEMPFIGPRPPNEALSVGAVWPGVINGVVLTGYNAYVAPNPWGPLIDGIDIVAKCVQSAYTKLGFNVQYVDDWNSHHNSGGEVHCGTNTIRETS